jgi:hypothetical protein
MYKAIPLQMAPEVLQRAAKILPRTWGTNGGGCGGGGTRSNENQYLQRI